VLVISDQHRADTMPGVRAAACIRTPHLDWLAQRGTFFRRAFCTDPVCTPARASLLSGLYPHTTGMVANDQARLPDRGMRFPADVPLLADYLAPAGYACGYTGKWHLGTGGDRRGFSDFVQRSGDHDVDGPDQNHILQFAQRASLRLGDSKALGIGADPDDFDRETRTGASHLPLAWHPSMRDAEAAAGFIRSMARQTRPFAVVFSCHEPHPPFVCPSPFDRMYELLRDDLPLPHTRRETAAAERVTLRGDRKLKSTERWSDVQLRAMWAAYYGAVSYVDHLVGTILAALIDTGEFDRTLFIFTADHGEMLGSHGIQAKGAVLYDELINIPLLIKPPSTAGAPGGHTTSRLVSHVDLLPTILGWCGVAAPAGLHGRDIRDLVEGGDTPVHYGIAAEYHSGNWGERPIPLRAWRTEDWKYVESQCGTDELYDLRAVPAESHNLIDHAPEQRETMKAALYHWLECTGDQWPVVRQPPPGAQPVDD
jgi:arylsulfatase A-like enzyme